MPQLYDLTILLDADAPEERRTAAVAEVHKLIGAGGEMVGEHEWGVRRMAYEIDHHAEAEYRLFQFKGEGELLERLRHSLRIMDGVLRHRIIRLKAGSPPPPPPRESAPRPREEREPEGRVAARAAADALPPDEGLSEAPVEAPADAPVEAPADAPAETPAEAPPVPDDA
jgi:small subunit ribosomal protein S6